MKGRVDFSTAQQHNYKMIENKLPVFDWSALDALTDEEVIARAESDPDNPPLTEEQLKRTRRVLSTRPLRFRLGLSQEAFAERSKFHWECCVTGNSGGNSLTRLPRHTCASSAEFQKL